VGAPMQPAAKQEAEIFQNQNFSTCFLSPSLVDFSSSHVISSFLNNVPDHKRLSGTTFTVSGRYLKIGTSFLKRVTDRISKYFQEAKQTLFFNFLSKKAVKNCENHQRSFKKYRFVFLHLKTILITLRYPLKLNSKVYKSYIVHPHCNIN
jgi:hypothetical protein